MSDIWDVLDTAKETYEKYKPLVDVAGSAVKGYLDYKDAKKRNELEQKAYDDYMKAAAEAAKEAQTAIKLNLTPMTVSGVPKTKADVTDYTAATGLKHGGISGLRKKYAEGMDEFEVEEMDEEIITPEYLMKEEGVEIGPMASGKYTQEEIEAYENYKYEMNEQKPGFPIMEIDEFLRFWYSTVKGKENKMMASNDANERLLESLYEQYLELGLSPDEAAKKAREQFDSMGQVPQVPMDQQGIMQAAKGGIAGLRKKYSMGTPDTDVEIMDEEFVGDNELKMEEGVQIGPMAGGGARGWKAQMLAEDWAWDRYGKEFYDLPQMLQIELYGEALDFIDDGYSQKQGAEDMFEVSERLSEVV